MSLSTTRRRALPAGDLEGHGRQGKERPRRTGLLTYLGRLQAAAKGQGRVVFAAIAAWLLPGATAAGSRE